MDWIGCTIKLLAWSLVGRKNRWGFILSLVGNGCLGWVAYENQLFGIVAYCMVLSAVQVVSWWNWRTK